VVLNAITLTLISKLDPLDLTTFVEVTDQWSSCIINTEANGYNSQYIVENFPIFSHQEDKLLQF
jgi:hypothetical protein